MDAPTRNGKTDADVLIIGGGLAGLTAAILLAGAGKNVLVLEKKTYPFHKVCGEYVSTEVLGFLESIGFSPFAHDASRIKKLRISAPSGKNSFPELGAGGFGLSRYTMDHEMAKLAEAKGAQLLTGTKVTDVTFDGTIFTVKTSAGNSFTAKLVIGSYGKRDALDKKLNRDFIREHTGYLAVKYHVATDYPADEIGLDNFAGGYCGIVKVEGDRYNVCYLHHRKAGDRISSIPELEETVLFTNPVIKRIFASSDFLLPGPEVINQVSFARKAAVDRQLLMCGDSAGLITPLCGNGMSMAIHAAKLLSELVLSSGILGKENVKMEEREQLARAYTQHWNKNFRSRLTWGKALQNCFAVPFLAEISLRGLHFLPALERRIISATRGKPLPGWR